MNIPSSLSKSTIAQLACPDTVAVRVLLHSVSNNGSARLRCRNRQYIFERSHETGCHILDIPMSIWMAGVNPGRYRDQRSVCDDFRELPGAAFTIHLIGTAPEAAAPEAPGALAEIRRLLSALGAPEEVATAFNLAAENPGSLAGYVDGILADLEDTKAPSHDFASGSEIHAALFQQEPERARNEDGTFVADDPATPDVNEAYKHPEEVPAAEPLPPAYTKAEAKDLENLHWKTFEKKYGMLKADFIASKETADTDLV